MIFQFHIKTNTQSIGALVDIEIVQNKPTLRDLIRAFYGQMKPNTGYTDTLSKVTCGEKQLTTDDLNSYLEDIIPVEEGLTISAVVSYTPDKIYTKSVDKNTFTNDCLRKPLVLQPRQSKQPVATTPSATGLLEWMNNSSEPSSPSLFHDELPAHSYLNPLRDALLSAAFATILNMQNILNKREVENSFSYNKAMKFKEFLLTVNDVTNIIVMVLNNTYSLKDESCTCFRSYVSNKGDLFQKFRRAIAEEIMQVKDLPDNLLKPAQKIKKETEIKDPAASSSSNTSSMGK